MPIELIMPKLSDTMEEGTILRWFKGVGDYVATGEVVAEVETDKADMELEASNAGTVAEIRVKEGEAAVVGTVIAVLRDGGEARPPATQEAEQPAARSEKAEPRVAEPHSAADVPPPPPKATAVGAPPRTQPQPPPGPPAKRGEARAPGTTEAVPHGRHALPKLRLAVAKQMTTSKRETPHFYVTGEFNMSPVADLRASLAASPAIPERITFTHFIIRAVALTLLRHPRLNASWSEDSISYHEDINIGVAVALEDGLVAPVLRNCQNLSLRAIARATTDLVAQAQAGRFSGEALTGATFTVSNLGMLDIEEFSAVITPPQAAILAVGSIKDRPVVRNGQLAIAKTMRATLSVDHRVLNGVEAGRFLEDLKRALENPAVLIIGSD